MAEPEPGSSGGSLHLIPSAHRLGHAVWLERRLHQVLGGWVATTHEPAATVLLDAHALHHAWFASVLFDRLPELRELPRESLVVPSGDDAAAALAELADSTSVTVDRLDAVYSVLVPAVLEGYRVHAARLAPVADAPLQRWLRIVIGDLGEDAAAGAELLSALGGGSASAREDPPHRLLARRVVASV